MLVCWCVGVLCWCVVLVCWRLRVVSASTWCGVLFECGVVWCCVFLSSLLSSWYCVALIVARRVVVLVSSWFVVASWWSHDWRRRRCFGAVTLTDVGVVSLCCRDVRRRCDHCVGESLFVRHRVALDRTPLRHNLWP